MACDNCKRLNEENERLRELLIEWLGAKVVSCAHYTGTVMPPGDLVQRTAIASFIKKYKEDENLI